MPLNAFSRVLEINSIDPKTTPINQLTEDAVIWLATMLKDFSPATERLYLTAATLFFEYIAANKLSEINLPRLRLLIRQHARRPGQRLPQFQRDAIEKIVDYSLRFNFRTIGE